MRISNNLISAHFLGALRQSRANMLQASRELSSGLKLHSAGQDPVSSSKEVSISNQSHRLSLYDKNATAAYSQLSLEEVTLGDVVSRLQRTRELFIASANDAGGPDVRLRTAEEVKSIRDDLHALANRTAPNGEYLFSGYQNVKPFDSTYAYLGDSGVRKIQIGTNYQIQSTDNGQSVFLDIPSASGPNQSLFTTMDQFITELSSNISNPDTLTNLDNALTHISTIRSNAGSRMQSIDQQKNILSTLSYDAKENLSYLRDTDYADAAARFTRNQTQTELAIQSYKNVQSLSLFNVL